MWFDIACLIIALVGFFYGYRRGFFAQAGSVAGIILGIVICNIFAGRVTDHFVNPDDSIATVLLTTVMVYVLMFVACYIFGRLCGSALGNIAKAVRLSCLDKIAGAVFTTFEYALVFSLILNAWIGAFPNTELRSDYSGVKRFVLNLAPTVLGSKTVSEIFTEAENGGSESESNGAE